jgi:aryl-alcohol dehydrogenase-like predicted oxidoreductase
MADVDQTHFAANEIVIMHCTTLQAMMSRATFLRLAGATVAGLLLGGGASAAAAPAMQRRPSPGSGELLPVIGLGTWRGFDFAPGSPEYARLPGVLEALFAAGGSVIDSSPMYGRAEENVGDLLAAAGTHHRAFIASKVWTSGREEGLRQLRESRRRLRAGPRLDLMQVHNLVDWRTQLATLRDWQTAGRLRYVGVSHYHAGAYDELAAVLRAERLDFLQINYSLDEREAERTILPLAAERGTAVLINRPFGGGGLLRRLRQRPLPAWAGEIGATSWAQLLLKFVLAQPAVTCAIPGTSRPEHMTDNAAAAFGPMPEAAFWRRHPELFD